MRVSHINFRDTGTQAGNTLVQFDSEGVSQDIDEALAVSLCTIPGFSLVPDPASVTPAPDEDAEEDNGEDDKPDAPRRSRRK